MENLPATEKSPVWGFSKGMLSRAISTMTLGQLDPISHTQIALNSLMLCMNWVIAAFSGYLIDRQANRSISFYDSLAKTGIIRSKSDLQWLWIHEWLLPLSLLALAALVATISINLPLFLRPGKAVQWVLVCLEIPLMVLLSVLLIWIADGILEPIDYG